VAPLIGKYFPKLEYIKDNQRLINSYLITSERLMNIKLIGTSNG